MERIFFRIVAVGFLCMTLTLILGAFATDEAYGVYFNPDHKTVLTWIAWCLFCVLLGGRYFAGWRAKTALNWFWAGCAVFAVAYFGYSFVIELMA
ncbi:cytochrome c assembly protein [gut metagenome]|uniref:Cytochrome c assembly protein n=1 Tax=gut metagenome TaxID=749906 RepID=J9GAX6_9ZZZZ